MSSAPSQTSWAIAAASLLRVQALPVCNVMVLHATQLVPRAQLLRDRNTSNEITGLGLERLAGTPS